MEVPQSTALLLNIPSSFYYSSVYLVTPMTFPQKATNRITHVFSFWFLPMSSMWEVFHTTIAITKLNHCSSVGTNLFVFRKAAVPLLLKDSGILKKGTTVVRQLSQTQQKTPCFNQDGSPSLSHEDFIFAELKGDNFVTMGGRKVAYKNYVKETEYGSPALQKDSLPSQPPGKPIKAGEFTLGNILAFVYLLSHVLLLQNPRTVACQAPLTMEFPRQEYWSGLPCPSPGDLPDPGIEPASPGGSCTTGGFFTEPPEEAQGTYKNPILPYPFLEKI